MKRHLAVFLAFLMAFSALAAISPVSAANETEAGSTPDDAFDGNYTEFEGEDGSVTRVFDNGSVSTKNTDGSVTAVDYKGNQYSEDKDGNSTVRTTDGYVATEYKDGRQSLTEPNGKTTTVNTDGSFSESYGVGLTLDYNADGGLTGIGITGSDERIETDENGCYKSGEITGPNGAKLTITDDGLQFVNSEGTSYNHTDLGNKQTTTIDRKDGSHAEAETSVTWNGDEKTENTDYTITDSDGNRWDSNTNITYDSDGNPRSSKNNVVQWTGADGSTLWMDNNSKAVQYSDKNGNKLITDPNGNVTEYKDGKNSWNVTYDGNGNVTSADVTYSDGAKMVQNPDGTTTFTLPDGTEYKSDGKGNVFKNGEQIKKDGEWVEGYDPAKDTGKADDKSDDSKPEEPAADTGYTGGYYGTYDYTAYWDGGKQKQGERSYYVFEYNGCYYLVQAKNPDDVKNRIKEDGVEGFFKSYYDDRLTAENASFDPATRTATYLEKSYMNDVQYISTVYTIVFDGNGGVTISWESQNVYKEQSEPQESGTFTGKKK
ncbi:MAG: hypothetical protein IJ788_01905 [Oscillospiraceae bacterium]|nr:hypothetical protein [Oscillospiraceae bacterium]